MQERTGRAFDNIEFVRETVKIIHSARVNRKRSTYLSYLTGKDYNCFEISYRFFKIRSPRCVGTRSPPPSTPRINDSQIQKRRRPGRCIIRDICTRRYVITVRNSRVSYRNNNLICARAKPIFINNIIRTAKLGGHFYTRTILR